MYTRTIEIKRSYLCLLKIESPWHGIISFHWNKERNRGGRENECSGTIEMQRWIKNPIIYQFQLYCCRHFDTISAQFVNVSNNMHTIRCEIDEKKTCRIFKYSLKSIRMNFDLYCQSIFSTIFSLYYQKIVRTNSELLVLWLQIERKEIPRADWLEAFELRKTQKCNLY